MTHKILLIDESAMLRRMAANILHAQAGRYQVVSATRAAEGFARACAGDVDLILLDYQIACFAEAELCQLLRADKRTTGVPTVLMVGQGIQPPTLESLPVNVVETLTKPVAPEQLTGVVNAIFGFTRSALGLEEIRASLHPGFSPQRSPTNRQLPLTNQPDAEVRQLPDPVSLERGPRIMVAEQPTGFNAKRKVVLQGDTRTTSLPSLVRSICDARHSGILHLGVEKEAPCEIFFDRGRVLVVSTRDGDTYAARSAEVLPAKVSPATLEDAVAEQRATGTPFLLTLGTRGLLSKAAAVTLLRHFSDRHFARLWLQRGRPVHFEFSPLGALPGFALRLEPAWVSADEWLLGTTRHLRMDDVMTSLQHEGSVGSPVILPGGESILQALKLTEDEQKFVGFSACRKDLPKIAEALKTTQEAAYLLLYRFRCLEAMGYRTAPAAFVMTPRTHPRRVLPLNR